MCGDPPNIIIGTSLGMSFSDFVTNTGLIAIVSLVAVVIYFYLVFRKELASNAVTKIRRLSGSFRGYHQQGWICDQLDHLPVCSGSSGNTFTDRTYCIMYWSIHCSCHIAYSRKRCTGSSEKKRIKNLLFLCRIVCRCRRSGKNNPYAAGWLYRKCQWG